MYLYLVAFLGCLVLLLSQSGCKVTAFDESTVKSYWNILDSTTLTQKVSIWNKLTDFHVRYMKPGFALAMGTPTIGAQAIQIVPPKLVTKPFETWLAYRSDNKKKFLDRQFRGWMDVVDLSNAKTSSIQPATLFLYSLKAI